MPTKRPRHLIVETEPISHALSTAAKRWPDEHRPSRLLIRLIERGEESMAKEETAAVTETVNAVAKTRGILTGLYGPNYLDDLRQDWPK